MRLFFNQGHEPFQILLLRSCEFGTVILLQDCFDLLFLPYLAHAEFFEKFFRVTLLCLALACAVYGCVYTR
jgi:hypothetical protein